MKYRFFANTRPLTFSISGVASSTTTTTTTIDNATNFAIYLILIWN